MKSTKAWLLLGIAASLLLAMAVAWFAIRSTLESYHALPDAYASDWTAIFVIDHLRTSDGAWPKDWSDLKDEFDRMAEPNHYAWTFEELQQRVDIRFDVDPQELRDADPPLEVIRLTSGRRVSFDGDPNLLIRDYLRAEKMP